MGFILDLAVAALALVVVGSLALLAWTLAFDIDRGIRRAEDSLARVRERLRARVAAAEARADAATSHDASGETLAP